MLKQIAAALLAASVIAAPAFAAETASKPAAATSKPTTETGKPAAETKVKASRHVRHHVRHHVTHLRKHGKSVKQAKPANSGKPMSATTPKSPGQAATTPPAK